MTLIPVTDEIKAALRRSGMARADAESRKAVIPILLLGLSDPTSAVRKLAFDSLVALDIPLLLETGGERQVDLVVVVSAPAVVQRGRALRRPGMTPAKLARIRARQLDERQKRRRADVVIPTGLGRDLSLRRLKRLVRVLRRRRRVDSATAQAKG